LPDEPGQQALIRSVPHVVAIAPRLEFSGLVSHGEATMSFIGEGVDPAREQLLSAAVTITEGKHLAVSDPLGIVIGQGLAANLGVKPGDTVVLLANTAKGGVNAIEAHVLGLFRTVSKAYDDAALRVPIDAARQLLRVSGSHSYALVLDKTENTDAVVSLLRQRFSGQAIEFIPWYRMADFYNKTARLFSRQVAVLNVIIAVIIVLGISNLMMMSVLERTAEIGTSMALGAGRRTVLLLFVSEGTLLGIVGGVAGLLGGFALAKTISAVGIPMPPPPGMSYGYTAGIMTSWPVALQSFTLAIVATLAASIYPAWKASRLTIVDALRHSR
jgi:putative ABC transport system permease protein